MRWNLILPVAGLIVAFALSALAVLAESAFRSRHALALDGRYLRLAHRLEIELREEGPMVAADILEKGRDEEQEFVSALVLVDTSGEEEVQSWMEPPGNLPAHDIDLFVGRRWSHPNAARERDIDHDGDVQPGQPGYQGRRTLRIFETVGARQRPLSEAMLIPAVALVDLIVVALSFLGGRLLTRQKEHERLESTRRHLGRAGAGLAHQLRTPLATIKGSCQLLLENADPAVASRLAVTVGESERMERLLGRLLDYARPPDPEARRIGLASLFDEIRELDPRVTVIDGDGLEAEADRDHLRQILVNLVENALEASDKVEVKARRKGARIEIQVLDHGPGPGNDPESLFEPYVTHREGGTGLGLPIARALAEANHGELRLESRSGRGSRAVLVLPAAGETA